MINANSLKKLYIILLILVLTFTGTILLSNINFVNAENTDVKISMTSNSLFDAYGETFVWTYDTNLYLAVNNETKTLQSAFSGECIDITMDDTYILTLSKTGSSNVLSAFTYDENGITQVSCSVIETVHALFRDENNKACIVYDYGTSTTMAVFEPNKEAKDFSEKKCWWPQSNTTNYVDYLYVNGRVFFINKNGEVLTEKIGNEVTNLTTVSNISSAKSLTALNSNVYVNTLSGIISLSTSNLTTLNLGNVVSTGKISAISYNSSNYLMVQGNNAIVQYALTNTSVEYINKFDNSGYTHPTEFDIVKVAMLENGGKVYSSPRNLQVIDTLNSQSIVLVLCEKNSDVINKTYYYIVTKDGKVGYIENNFNLLNCTLSRYTDTSKIDIGTYAQGLHEKTTIYKYPFDTGLSAEEDYNILTTVSIYEQLAVVDNVAVDQNNKQAWDYYKVGYVQDGTLYYGYVKKADVAPYTSITAPKVLKTIKVRVDTVGDAISIYSLPTDESTKVGQLTDGYELQLAEEYDESKEWTKVVYKDTYAYVKTANIQQNGLTTVQITLIVIAVIVVVATLTMVGILMYKKKKSY